MIDAFPINKKQAARLLSNPDSDSLAVFVAFCALLGTDEVLGEDADDPADVYNQLEEMLGIQIPVEVEARFLACKHALETDLVHTRVQPFCVFANAVAEGDSGVDSDGTDVPDWSEIMWADYVYRILREDVGDMEYAPGVMRLMVGALKEFAGDADESRELADYKERMQLRMIADLRSLGVPDSILRDTLKDAKFPTDQVRPAA